MMMKNNGTTSSALDKAMVFYHQLFELFRDKSVRNFKLPACVGEILFS